MPTTIDEIEAMRQAMAAQAAGQGQTNPVPPTPGGANAPLQPPRGPPATPFVGPPAPGTTTLEEVELARQKYQKDRRDFFTRAFSESIGRGITSAAPNSPERRAAVLKLARETGVPVTNVEKNFGAVLRTYAATNFDVDRWLDENKDLADILYSKQLSAPVVMGDEKVGILTKALRYASTAVTLGQAEGLIPSFDGILPTSSLSADARPSSGELSEALATNLRLSGVLPPKQMGYVQDARAREGQALTGLSRLKAPVMTFQDALVQNKRAEIGFKLLLSAPSAPGVGFTDLTNPKNYELEKELVDVDSQAVPRDYGGSSAEQNLHDIAQVTASSVPVIEGGGALAALGFGTMAVGALFTPITMKQAWEVAMLFGKAGATYASFKQEAGSAFLEYRQAKTDDGTPVNPWVAKGGALAYGAIAAWVESMSFDASARLVGPVGDAVAKGELKSLVLKRLAGDSLFRKKVAHLAEAWAERSTDEAMEEVIQTTAQDLIGYLNKSAQAGEFQDADVAGTVINAANAGLQALKATAASGAAGGAVRLGARPAVAAVDTALALPIAAVAIPAQKIVSHLGKKDAATRSAAQLAAIHEAAGGETAKNDPKTFAEFIESQTAQHGEPVTHVYVDPGVVRRLAQNTKTSLRDLMGADALLRLQDAEASGTKIEVPMEDYAAKWVPSKLDGPLLEHLTTRPATASPFEVRTQDEQLTKDATRIANEIAQEEKEAEKEAEGGAETKPKPKPKPKKPRKYVASAAEKRLADRLMDRLAKLPGYSEDDAKKSVTLNRAVIRTLAQRMSLDPDVLFEKTLITLEKGEGGAPSVAVAQTSRVVQETTTAAAMHLRAAQLAKKRNLRAEEAHHLDQYQSHVIWLQQQLGETAAQKAILAVDTEKAKVGYSSIVDVRESPQAAKRTLAQHVLTVFTRPTEAPSTEAPSTEASSTEVKRFNQTVNGFMERIDDLYRIVLNPEADFSTFLHESAHVFLEMFGDVAEREGASPRVVADYQAALKWLGVERRDQIKTEHHEKWARAFERYLMEGKAPSKKLAAAFARFQRWMTTIYGKAEALGVELNDDIRGVFDRLLATDSEIRRVKSSLGRLPLFRSHTEMGVSPEAYQEYLDEQEEADSYASRSTNISMMKSRLREAKKWWKEELAYWHRAAQGEYENLPARRTFMFLKGKAVADDGTEITVGDPIKLNRAVVEQALGKDVAKGIPMAKNGMDPNILAQALGYTDGAIMLQEMAALPEKRRWVEKRADEKMHELHPDEFDRISKLEQKVGEALHDIPTTKWFLRELAALGKRVGRKPGPIAEAHKRAARIVVGRRAVSTLRAGAVAATERALANRTIRAVARQDYGRAFVLQLKRLLNIEIWKETNKAVKERTAFLKLSKQLRRKASQVRLGKSHIYYRDGVNSILEALDLKTRERRSEPPASLEEVAKQLEADGHRDFDPTDVKAIIANPRSWKGLTVDEMRAVHDALKRINKAAADRTKVKVGAALEEKAVVISALTDEAATNRKDRGPVVEDPSILQRIGGVFNGIDGSLLKIETMVDKLGGGGTDSTFYRVFIKPIQDAIGLEHDILTSTIRPIVEKFEKMPKSLRNNLSERIDGDRLFPNHKNDKITVPRTKWQLLMLVLNIGNPDNVARLQMGRGITREQVIAAAEEYLPDSALDWAQSVLDAAESLWPLVKAQAEKIDGVAPPKVQAQSFQVRNAVYRGGYWPAIYNWEVGQTTRNTVGATIADYFDSFYISPSTPHGFLKRRVKNFDGVISLDPSLIYRHLAQVAHDLAFREPVSSVAKLLLEPEVDQLLRRYLGTAKARQFNAWLMDVGRMRGTEITPHAAEMNKMVRWLRGNFGRAVLGYKPSIALGDLTNAVKAVIASPLKAKHWGAGVAYFIRHPVEARTFVLTNSSKMRSLQQSDAHDFARQLKKFKQGWWDNGPMSWYNDFAFAFVETMSKASTTPVWVGAYRQAVAEGRTHEDAVEFADKIIRDNFAGFHPADKAGILRDPGFFGAATIFYSFLNVAYNRQHNIIDPPGPKGRSGTALAQIGNAIFSAGHRAGQLMAYYFVFNVVDEFLMGRGPEEDDGDTPEERWAHWFLRKMGGGPVTPIPIANEAYGAFEQLSLGHRASIRYSPLTSYFTYMGQLAMQFGKEGGVDNAKALKAAFMLYATTRGIPTFPVVGTGAYIKDLYEHDLRAHNPSEFLSGLLYGQRPGQPANPIKPYPTPEE